MKFLGPDEQTDRRTDTRTMQNLYIIATRAVINPTKAMQQMHQLLKCQKWRAKHTVCIGATLYVTVVTFHHHF